MHFTGARYLPWIIMLLKHPLFVSLNVVRAYAIHHNREKRLNQNSKSTKKKKRTIVRAKENIKLSHCAPVKDMHEASILLFSWLSLSLRTGSLSCYHRKQNIGIA